jgi:hypothetical protein
MPDFDPIYDIGLIRRAWSAWVQDGRPSTIPADFFERVLLNNDTQLAHLQWYDQMLKWKKTNRKYQ